MYVRLAHAAEIGRHHRPTGNVVAAVHPVLCEVGIAQESGCDIERILLRGLLDMDGEELFLHTIQGGVIVGLSCRGVVVYIKQCTHVLPVLLQLCHRFVKFQLAEESAVVLGSNEIPFYGSLVGFEQRFHPAASIRDSHPHIGIFRP